MENNLFINLQVRKRRRSKARYFKFFALLFIGILIGYFILNTLTQYLTGKPVELIKPSFSILSPGGSPSNQSVKDNPLGAAIKSSLAGVKGTYGIAVKNLKTNEQYFENEHRVYEAGSLYKLWVMATVVGKIQVGEWTEEQVLSESIASLNNKFDIDPELAEQTTGAITLSVRNALKQMITISHNYAALLLTEKVKLSTVAKFLEDSKLYESKVGVNGEAPTTTPADMALFFEKLYKGELANEQYTNMMIDLLKEQKLNEKLPKYLPKGTEIAHKTGEIGWFSHDGGIVYSPKGNYTIVVLSESESPAGANDRIAQVSKAVYEYFLKKK